MHDTVLLVATGRTVLRVDAGTGTVEEAEGLRGQLPTCLAGDARRARWGWCGTAKGGVFRTETAGRSWYPAGLSGEHVTALAASPALPGVVWAGTEPSAVWRFGDGAPGWVRTADLLTLPSSSEWSFPPKPETHHVRWITVHPSDPGRLWVAIEAGALVRSFDGGASWVDRVPGGPWDTHELALHPGRPELLRSAAGDGFLESEDGGESWSQPEDGLEVSYFRSVAVDPGDPEVVVASAASRPRSAYMAGHSDGRIYRREGKGAWERIRAGWPDPPSTIAPLLRAGTVPGQLWGADERGVHHSRDAGKSWEMVVPLPPGVTNLRGLLVLARDVPQSRL
jgi:photosystem II stability/assembly factor-like uncharacterized protein